VRSPSFLFCSTTKLLLRCSILDSLQALSTGHAELEAAVSTLMTPIATPPSHHVLSVTILSSDANLIIFVAGLARRGYPNYGRAPDGSSVSKTQMLT
jgi:hypothetical protein